MPFELPAGRVAVMGVLNVTPDSFSDGGQFFEREKAIARGLLMVEEGADLIDVGGESTRPGAAPVPAEEELRRVLPVVSALAARSVAVSIDTSKHEVAARCLGAGAQVVNDVTALLDPQMAALCAREACTVCLMHMKGEPRTMQEDPVYEDVVQEVRAALSASAARAEAAGVNKENVWLDPGIGFGKTLEHNLRLLNRLDDIVSTGFPVMVGVSRKSFIGRLLGAQGVPLPVEQRTEGTVAAQVVAQMRGARVLRTHDVLAAKRAAAIVGAILKG